jgi:hypothetical protein
VVLKFLTHISVTFWKISTSLYSERVKTFAFQNEFERMKPQRFNPHLFLMGLGFELRASCLQSKQAL